MPTASALPCAGPAAPRFPIRTAPVLDLGATCNAPSEYNCHVTLRRVKSAYDRYEPDRHGGRRTLLGAGSGLRADEPRLFVARRTPTIDSAGYPRSVPAGRLIGSQLATQKLLAHAHALALLLENHARRGPTRRPRLDRAPRARLQEGGQVVQLGRHPGVVPRRRAARRGRRDVAAGPAGERHGRRAARRRRRPPTRSRRPTTRSTSRARSPPSARSRSAPTPIAPSPGRATPSAPRASRTAAAAAPPRRRRPSRRRPAPRRPSRRRRRPPPPP